MAEIRVKNLVPANVDGKDSKVKDFKKRLSKEAKKAGGKLEQFSVDDGTITVTFSSQDVADVIRKKLESLKEATIVMIDDGLDGFIQTHNDSVESRS